MCPTRRVFWECAYYRGAPLATVTVSAEISIRLGRRHRRAFLGQQPLCERASATVSALRGRVIC